MLPQLASATRVTVQEKVIEVGSRVRVVTNVIGGDQIPIGSLGTVVALNSAGVVSVHFEFYGWYPQGSAHHVKQEQLVLF